MNILNVVLGLLCILIAFVIAARSGGLRDRFLWGAVVITGVGGVALPRLLPGDGARLVLIVISLAALLLLLRRQQQRQRQQ
ncbi:hypothetical protein [Streptomyces cyaneofuscatus]|uniref:hypothetical protein n=1 Tax=Streptomyces cyaneofuscatus TaxID=66883 RepID=UPI0036CBCA9C